jgi:hypothetical protein
VVLDVYLLGSIQHAEPCLFCVYAVYFLNLIWAHPSFQKEEFAVKGKGITFLLKNFVLTPTMIIDSASAGYSKHSTLT